LLNAYEADNHFNGEESLYLIRLSNNKLNDEQIIKLINSFAIKEKSFVISINSKHKKLKDLLKIFILKFYIFVIQIKFEKVFIGNIESGLLSLLTKNIDRKKKILLDDGAKSLVIQKKFTDDYNLNFFSFYDLKPFKNQIIYKNDFKKLKETISFDNSENEILLLGSKLSEVSIIEESYHVELIKKISNYFENEMLIYIPHREENISKLEKIAKEIKNIKIKHINYPVEFYGINENIKIKMVVSFYSTALYTISKIYNCETIAFKFNYEKSEHKKNIDEVYDFYKKYMKVIEL
jgi:hypothetical protein